MLELEETTMKPALKKLESAPEFMREYGPELLEEAQAYGGDGGNKHARRPRRRGQAPAVPASHRRRGVT